MTQLVLVDNGQQIGTFQRLVGISSPNPALQFQYESGPGALIHTKQYGKTRPPQVVLEAGMATIQLWKWHLAVRAKNPNARQTVILEGFTTSGKILFSFTLHNAWPSRLEITSLKGGKSVIPVARLTLQCDGITRNT